MTPYYEHGGITIYHGDCREIAPLLERPDILASDPDYAAAAATVTTGWGKARHGGNWGSMSLVTLMVDATLDATQSPSQVIWMCDHLGYAAVIPALFRRYQLVQSVVWDKDCLGMGAYFRKQTEFVAYARRTDSPGCVGTKRDLIRIPLRRTTGHPAEKPIALMETLLLGLGGDCVMDPYCGSGTTMIAATRQGRRAIGIEIEERYCEIAAKRLEQEVLALA